MCQFKGKGFDIFNAYAYMCQVYSNLGEIALYSPVVWPVLTVPTRSLKVNT